MSAYLSLLLALQILCAGMAIALAMHNPFSPAAWRWWFAGVCALCAGVIVVVCA